MTAEAEAGVRRPQAKECRQCQKRQEAGNGAEGPGKPLEGAQPTDTLVWAHGTDFGRPASSTKRGQIFVCDPSLRQPRETNAFSSRNRDTPVSVQMLCPWDCLPDHTPPGLSRKRGCFRSTPLRGSRRHLRGSGAWAEGWCRLLEPTLGSPPATSWGGRPEALPSNRRSMAGLPTVPLLSPESKCVPILLECAGH